jgi:hypothetical protein
MNRPMPLVDAVALGDGSARFGGGPHWKRLMQELNKRWQPTT